MKFIDFIFQSPTVKHPLRAENKRTGLLLRMRTNNVLLILTICFCTFPDSEALNWMISNYRRTGNPQL